MGAAVAVVLAAVPPVATTAAHEVYAETIQFCLVAFALPALVVVGWPVRAVPGRAGRRLRCALERAGDRRRAHPASARAAVPVAADVVVVVVWRTPPFVDALERHGWLLGPEVLSLLVVGVLSWVELVGCPPLEPRLAPPRRAVAAAVSMWAVWVVAYVVGFSHVSWYHGFHGTAGGLGSVADQELSSGVLWLGALCAFVPVVFSDLLAWLRNGADPDAELRALVRRERRWGPPG